MEKKTKNSSISQLRKDNIKLKREVCNLQNKLVDSHNLLKYSRDFIYRHDAKGVFNFISPTVSDVTGYTPNEFMKHYTRYMTENTINKKVIQFTEDTLRTGKEHKPYLVEIRHKKGHNIMLEVSEKSFLEDKVVAGIVGTARDVTDRVELEKRVKQNREETLKLNRVMARRELKMIDLEEEVNQLRGNMGKRKKYEL